MTARRRSARHAAIEVVQRLANAGHVAYLAGGCVRDRLLGLDPKDHDVATDARPERVRELFPGSQSVGEAFGVILVRQDGHSIEVATFRDDGPYSDSRRPDSVRFSDDRADAWRRDFTINGLFEDPRDGRIIDHVHGQDDLAAHRIRAIGDPEARFAEDDLRMLRAVRFAARFGFAIEPATEEAIRRHAGDLQGVSRERIGNELRAMLGHASRADAIARLEDLGLASVALREEAEPPDLVRLSALPPETSVAVALAAWLRDRAPRTPIVDDGRIRGWSAALVLSNAETDRLGEIVRADTTIRREWPSLGLATRKRLASRPGFSDALELVAAVAPERASAVRREVDGWGPEGAAPAPLLSGNDLLDLGARPGPAVGRILHAIRDAQLELTVRTRDEARALARTLIASEGAAGE